MEVTKPIKFEFTAENKRGIMVLPKNCVPYILFIPFGCRFKRIVQMLATLAETLARW